MTVSSNEIGDLLLDLGLITPEQLSDAINQQQVSGVRLTLVLSEMGLVTERQLKDALELQYGVNFVNLSNAPPEAEFVNLVPEEIERKYRFVPVSKQGNQYTVAMVDPDDLIAADAVRMHLQSGNFKKLVCTADDFEHLMHVLYEKQPEPEVEEIDEDNHELMNKSPRASQTKLKAHMRNLFGADSDDDLDDMFGSQSADSHDAIGSAPAPAAEEVIENQEDTADQPTLAPAKGSVAKKITSLFGDDDDDFGDSDDEPAVEVVKPKSTKKAAPAKAKEEAPPAAASNQLLEHLVSEAEEAKPKSTKKTSKKKSMQSLFDDDDDMDFGDKTEAEAPQEEPAPEPEIEDAPKAEIEVEAEAPPAEEESQTASAAPSGKPFRSLFDDDDDDMEGLGEESPQAENAPVVEEQEEQAEMPEEEPTSEASEEPREEQPAESTERSASPGKPFRSLFDDDVDEDDLFQDADPMSLNESLTGERFVTQEEEAEEAVSEDAEQTEEVEPTEEGESAESLLSAIDKPFQSLFDDDEDDDELFGTSSEEGAPEVVAEEETVQEPVEEEQPELPVEEEEQPEAIEEEPPEVEGEPEAEFVAEAQAEEEEEPILPAYSSNFDDEMDEDSLFASASHPIPEGAPQLRDLLSRFDDSEESFAEPQAEVSKSHAVEVTQLSEKEASPSSDSGLPVEALLAALDEQMPDEPFKPAQPAVESESEAEPEQEPEVGAEQPAVEEQIEEQIEEEPEEEPVSLYEEPLNMPASVVPQYEEPQPDLEPEPEPEPAASEEVEEEPVRKAQPKSRRLRALMSEFDEDEFEKPATPVDSDTEFSALEETPAPEPVQEREEFEEILPLDRESLAPVESATSELPPVVVSMNASKTMTQGTPEPEQEIEVPAVASFDEEAPASEPEPVAAAAPLAAKEATLTATASELPDALEDVLASVTNEIIDNVELANLSGNRTEISFLEEIVESELAMSEEYEEAAAAAAPAPAPAAEPAAPKQPPAPAPSPVATQPATPAPQPVPTPVQTPVQPQAAPQPVAAQIPAAQAPAATPEPQAELDPSILNLATQILTQAVNSPCSDVHFEPLADGLALRFMSDGDLLDETILPAQIQGMLILCLKSMAGLDTAVVDRPQDKKFVTKSFGDPVEMRITSIPGVHGEMVAVSLKT